MDRTILGCFVVALSLLLGSCGGNDDPAAHGGGSHDQGSEPGGYSFGEPAEVADADRTIKVEGSDRLRFDPDSIEVAAGETVAFEHRVDGGLGIGHAEASGLRASALAVVNAVGDVLAADGSVLAGTTAPDPAYRAPGRAAAEIPMNTVLAVVAVEANLEKRDARFLASRGSDGVTVAVRPAHTRYDGDAVFAIAAPGAGPVTPFELDVLGHLATAAVADAVRHAVTEPRARSSRSAAGTSDS